MPFFILPKALILSLYVYIIIRDRPLSINRVLYNVLYLRIKMQTLGCFTCLNCGKVNPIKGNSYTNKFCNNSCQAQYRSRSLVQEWKEAKTPTAWRQPPEWVKKYLIQTLGHKCSVCNSGKHNSKPIPLVVDYIDGNTHNNEESNLRLVCPNCRAQR